jgi:hypothetical protein
MKTAKLIAFLIVVGMLLGVGYYFQGNYSEGDRAGTIIKLSRKGLVFKTFEGELNLGMGIHDGSSNIAISNIWPFSVSASDTATLRQLDSAMMSGKRAKVHYREKFVTVPWRGDTKYQVYMVEVSP